MHNAGSIIVIFNSARLVRQGEEMEHFDPNAEDSGDDQSKAVSSGSGKLKTKMA